MKKFGKLPPKFHPRTLYLSHFVTPRISAPPPEKRDWEYRVSDEQWAMTMLGNDTVGDCVIAAMMHYVMAATANTEKPAIFTTEEAIKTYSAITGYNPGDANTDQGTVYTDALAYWQQTGLKDTLGRSHKILGWAAIDFSNIASLRQAIAIFGGILVGTAVTQSMEDQFDSGEPWNPPYSGGVLGGHGIPWLGYGSEGQTCITWGKREQMALEAIGEVDEAYAVITQDFLDRQGESPSGLDLDALQAALAAEKAA